MTRMAKQRSPGVFRRAARLLRVLPSFLLTMGSMTALVGVVLAPPAVAQPVPPAALNPPLFSPWDILDAPGLSRTLSARLDPVSTFLWSRFPAGVQQVLADPGAIQFDQESALVEGLNAALQGGPVYDEQRFAGVALSPPTLTLAAQAPQGADLVWLNRLLLEDAYRMELRISPPPQPARPAGPGVSTDQGDYAPGSTANISGWDFQAGETVSLRVVHADGTPSTGEDHEPWTVVADASGGFQATWHVCEDDCLGATLRLTAIGQTSSRTAEAVFTDSPSVITFQTLMSFGKPAPGAGPYARLIQGTDGALYGTAYEGGAYGNGTAFKLSPDGSGFTVLKNFDANTTGRDPYAALMQGTDGSLYGTAAHGGAHGGGTVFKLNPDGSGFTVLRSFSSATTGGYLYGGLMQGTDGALYGTAHEGGAYGAGTVFKLNPDGTGFTILKNFDSSTTGRRPGAGLMRGLDGALYGTATEGGTYGHGTVYKLNPDGSGFTVIKSLQQSTNGGYPQAELIQGADGALYSTTFLGGSFGYGTAFRLNPDGSGFTVLKNFDSSTTGGYLNSGLMRGADDALYGTTYTGGSFGSGTIFKLNQNGTGFTILKNADGSTTGAYLFAGLLQGADGKLYGTAYRGGAHGYGTVYRLNLDGSGFTVLKALLNSADLVESGGNPWAKLLQGADGALYGTTYRGGTYDHGTLFRVNPDGTGFTVLRHFNSSTTGANPYSGLVRGTDGGLYGTTSQGGSSGYGTVYRLNADGTGFAVLKSFVYSTTGGNPRSLTQGADGALYGTASSGGSGGWGTVYRLNADGTGFAVLKNFVHSTTGGSPYAGLIQGADGALYGTAYSGGSGGYGTVFKLNTDGTGFAILRSFSYSTGGRPYAGLMLGTGGSLYGTTSVGGSGGSGMLFRLNSNGTGYTVLTSFNSTSGSSPHGELISGADGALYGTTNVGGGSGYGTLFRLNPDGTGFAVLLNFDRYTTGSSPIGGLIRGTDGAFYGTTHSGGEVDSGTVFRVLITDIPPTAVAGADQSIHAGSLVTVSGAGSFDDNTPSGQLTFEWSFSQKPSGSAAALANPSAAVTTFTADLPGMYILRLIVRDGLNQASTPDEVVVSSTNLAPTANAGPDLAAVVGQGVFLNASASTDPEYDTLTYQWTLDEAPAGSFPVLIGEWAPICVFIADLTGSYTVSLVVRDPFGPCDAPDRVVITAITGQQFVENTAMEAMTEVTALPPTSVTTAGNQQAFGNFLTEAIRAVQTNNLAVARTKLELAIARTDGCALRGVPDSTGPGRDWITDCDAQLDLYNELTAALNAIAP